MIIRATQKKMMSCPVISTWLGRYVSRSLEASGQPIVAIGQRDEENQVSRTSSSWTSLISVGMLYFRLAASSFSATKTLPDSS